MLLFGLIVFGGVTLFALYSTTFNSLRKASRQHNESLLCCLPENMRCDWVNDAPYTIPKCEEDNLIQILQWLDTLLKNHHIQWMILFGTLLGSIRHGKHIPFETDIDIAVIDRHWLLMEKIIHDEIRGTHFWFKPSSNINEPSRLYVSQINTVHIDIWRYKKYQTTTTLYDSTDGGEAIFWSIPNDKLYPYKKCSYNNHMYPCPFDSKWFLIQEYGKEWKIPHAKYGANATYKEREKSENQQEDQDGKMNIEKNVVVPMVAMSQHKCHTPKVGLYILPDTLLSFSLHSAPAVNTYTVFRSIIKALDSIQCPYNLHGSTLLNFVRDCDMKDSNSIDVAIPHKWQIHHGRLLRTTLQNAGFVPGDEPYFGDVKEFAYNVRWSMKDKSTDVKVNIFPSINKHSYYTTALWNNQKLYGCKVKRLGVGTTMWGELEVRVPIPYNMALSSLFGQYWRNVQLKEWNWSKNSFIEGSCL
jgi:hypothetical protein